MQIQWQDRFNIGVEIVDQAHRKLFSIVEKMTELYTEKHQDRFACVEGIKYFKAYAIKHFAEEEAYMRKIGYPDYPAHKRIHDKMKRETLPALEQELYASDFSTESVQRFIGVCIGWLTGHIIIEDHAITGKAFDEPLPSVPDDELSFIRRVIIRPLQEIFGLRVQFIGDFSNTDTIADAKYYELSCRGPQDTKLRFILIMGEPLLLRTAGLMLGIEFSSTNEIVRFAIREIAQSLIQRAAACFEMDSGAYQLEGDRFLEAEEYKREFKYRVPQYSLLFRIKEECFVLCFDQIQEAGCPAP